MQEVKENLPLISAFLIILGALNLILYYGYFDIDIMSYIDLSEILVLSISFYVKAAIALFIAMIFLTPASLRQVDNVLKSNESYLLHKQELAIIYFALLSVMILALFTMYDTYVDFAPTIDVAIAFVFLLFISISIGALKLFVNSFFKEIFKIEKGINYSTAIIVIISVALMTILYTRSNARNAAYKSNYAYAELILDSTIVKSDSIYKYIGKTKGFAFFYNSKTSKADAYPLDDVKKITVLNKHFFDGMLIKPKVLTNPTKESIKKKPKVDIDSVTKGELNYML